MNDFLVSLDIMWKGMLGLFMISALIMFLMMGISKIIKTAGKERKGAKAD
ncbi:MAG: hypothetical protein LBI90_09630 [Treponema sp.]|jgi:hypothetical protein|nr:hypothetical protein [Treponema sp.]